MPAQFSLGSQMAFGDTDGLKQWFADHAQKHVLYAKTISARFGTQTPLIDLTDELAMSAFLKMIHDGEDGHMTTPLYNWLFAHQRLHNVETGVLNIAVAVPTNLTTVDFRNKDQFLEWMTDHQALHDNEDSVLGVT